MTARSLLASTVPKSAGGNAGLGEASREGRKVAPTPPRPRNVGLGRLFLALLPALVLSILSVKLNHFTLIDDGVTLLVGRHGRFLDSFQIRDSGRVNFLYGVYIWAMGQVLPQQPWSFSVVNSGFLLVAAWQVYRLTCALSGTLAGIVAAWFFTLSLPTIEGIFTLAKAEPRQLVFWLAALALIWRVAQGAPHRLGAFESLWMLTCTVGAVFFKETGILLGVPLAMFAVIVWRARRTLAPSARHRSVLLLVAGAVPLATATALAVRYGLRSGSYPREGVMRGSLELTGRGVLIFEKDPLLALLLVAGVAGGLLLLLTSTGCRVLTALLLAQLLALVSFFLIIGGSMLYYYSVAVALAAVLFGAALFGRWTRRPGWRIAACVVALVLLSSGARAAIAAASALGGWSWLYDRLTNAVVTEKPRRVLFHQAGSFEMHFEARLVWGQLHGVPVHVGLLDSDGAPEPDTPSVSSRDLHVGDWIIEHFGTALNGGLPFRDLNITRSIEHGLIDQEGRTLLPLRVIHQYEVRFPLPAAKLVWFPSPSTYIQWRVYEVMDTPRVHVEGMDNDYWMRASAKVWIRAGESERMTLRFSPFPDVAPGGQYDNQLMVYAGDAVLARCPAEPTGVSECVFEPRRIPAGIVEDGWIPLELRAAKTFSPATLGVSPDTRSLSFNFAPTWKAGTAGLFGAARRAGNP